ncbi:hypothetical protein GGR52DRAFT_586373 [Hypoxylon sp. FL1284]|nr:hypothetical protein GGR52DRAFT_586373 [Hypoxylon sp. FL1284]
MPFGWFQLWRIHQRSTGGSSDRSGSSRQSTSTLTIYSNRDYDTRNVAPMGSSTVENREQNDGVELPRLSAQYRPSTQGLSNTQGLWLIFLDGMRWYPGGLGQGLMFTFFSESGRTPVFINIPGAGLGCTMGQPQQYNNPVFSYIPRSRQIQSNGFGPQPPNRESLATGACIRDAAGNFMVVPNGRLMVWVMGDRYNVPWLYFNKLRRRAGRINVPAPEESFPNPQVARNPQVPTSIHQIVREVAGAV